MKKSNETRLIWVLTLFFQVFLFVFSWYLFVTRPEPFVPRILFYEEIASKKILGESHSFALVLDQEKELKLLLEELVLGSHNPLRSAYLPKETRVLSVFIHGQNAYVNLSSQAIISGENFMRFKRLLHYTLRHHAFLQLKEVFFFIENKAL